MRRLNPRSPDEIEKEREIARFLAGEGGAGEGSSDKTRASEVAAGRGGEKIGVVQEHQSERRDLMRVAAVLSSLLVFGAGALAGEVQREYTPQVTLRGQVVCSACWEEEDRTRVAYGTKGDLACARKCAANGVSAALAVTEKSVTELYLLEDGKFPRKGVGWLDYIATKVEITGRVARGEGLPRLRVDALRSAPEKGR